MLLAGSLIRSTFSSWCRLTTCRSKAQVLGGWHLRASPKHPPATAAAHLVRCTASSAPPPTPIDASGRGSGDNDSATAAAPSGPTLATTDTTDTSMADAASMLTASDWDKLGEHLAAYDELREGVIKRCRDVQKLAKQAVYSLHRGDAEGAAKQLSRAESIAGEMLPTISRYPALRGGSFAAAIEEYVEARAFACFLAEGRLVRSDELPLAEPEEFLGGVLDFTGELNRYAIARATVRDKAAVQRCRDLVDALMGRFLKFDLRNGALRKKYDSLKYTLKKMESTLYELALTEVMGLKVSSEPAGMEPEVAGGEAAEGDA